MSPSPFHSPFYRQGLAERFAAWGAEKGVGRNMHPNNASASITASLGLLGKGMSNNSGSVKNKPLDLPSLWKFRKCNAEMYVFPVCESKTMGLLEELLRLVLFLKALLCSVGTCSLLIKVCAFNIVH